MKTTIRREKERIGKDWKFVTRQEAAKHLGIKDGSNVDRIMAGYPVLCLPRNDGKVARMYHMRYVLQAYIERSCRRNAPELFTAATMRKTARDARKAQQDADIKTLINMEG